MREPCIECVIKHIGQAMVLLEESELGYPLHKWRALGHLAEASSEAMRQDLQLAHQIRDARKILEAGEYYDLTVLLAAAVQVMNDAVKPEPSPPLEKLEPVLPLSLEEAKKRKLCRLCGRSAKENLPLRLDFGKEFAHVSCLELAAQQENPTAGPTTPYEQALSEAKKADKVDDEPF